MKMNDWAQMEIECAIKRAKKEMGDNKDDFFPYYESCLQSALKAYKSLCDDGHSGQSFSITRNILHNLLYEIPLSPINDEDFFIVDSYDNLISVDEKEMGIVSQKQCPRRFSLFRCVYSDGTIKYHDIDRAYCIDINGSGYPFNCHLTEIIDDMFPITMPYSPSDKAYKVYTEEFLMDPKNGDYDHQRVVKIETPDGETINVDDYCFREVNGKMERCTLEEFLNDKEKQIIK